ncbi:hypothetical protein DI09_7p30 [Mitosporidium daphniae]|uniref:Uncharacterized protein n=1 Tax=Mitosporidium daphniae TaxID=1485682 RepID=A0A098VN41_9MICR|nr:uncharacterized protein DI09_7p30 [Mitosporidium daphniae]KGG50224.1 hypothetical protein DI09_7p30 [Mitosporidium daphniae]|eukprot:XP_013236707.1 uncharacterized protein DI09_7p30 [Mitosporidium daphniae]
MDLEGMLRILSLDAEWLRLYNEQHADAKAYTFTENDFEAAIDAFEKEWHSLINPLILKEEFNTEVSDDSCCDVCGSPDASNANAIIFCDRCDMAVHQECYGVPSIPEGRWLCTKCGLIPNSIVNCTLCPHYEGAIKPTDDGGWAHIACAHYIEETGFSNETYLEPITGISQISPARLKLKCFLCKIKHGAPIQCSSKHCNVSFHVRCAQLANLSMDYMHKRTYCPRHTPNGQKDRTFNGIELNAQGTMPTEPIQTVNHQYFVPKGFKVEGASSETLPTLVPNIAEKNEQPNSEPIKISQMPPVSPEVIFSRIRNGEPWKHDSNKFPWKKVSTESSHQFEHFLRSVARYWSLKRDFKGVSLIRRLYLENSSPSSSLSEDVLEEITQRLRGVRFQLEMIRSLVELNKRLFELKLKDLQQIGRISNLLRVPTYHEQKDVLQKLKSIDKQKYFREPVSVEYAPDYLDIIENPMDFATIEFKLTTGKYLQKAQLLIPSTSKDSVHQQISSAAWELFKKDFDLICFNATTYNGPKTRWYKAAQNLNALGTPLIEQRQKASLCFLKEAIDWMQSPISEYLQVLCHQLCPYSKLPIEELFDEQKYGSSYKKSNPYSLIDVEY